MPSHLAAQRMLFDIVNVNEQFLIAVGERGHIVRSNNGTDWQQVDVGTNTTLTAVTFVNEQLGWAVGHEATILHTSDGGHSWRIQTRAPELKKPFLDVEFINEKEGIAVGTYGLLFRTIDAGKTWQQEYHFSFLLEDDVQFLEDLKSEDEQAYLEERERIIPSFHRVFIDGITTYLVGEVGMMAKSNDFGRTWQQFDNIYQGSFFDITRTQQGNLLTVGLRGHIYRSVNNGAPWQQVLLDNTALLNSIVLAGDSQIFVLGNNGVLLESVDDGNSFRILPQLDGKAMMAGVVFKEQLIVASEVGVKALQVVK